MSEWIDVLTEDLFRIYAERSGQILCSEPDGPPVFLQFELHETNGEKPCEKCGACV